LRDSAWYAAFLGRVRRRHPAHRVALLHVVAPPEVVQRRAAKRAARTGRVVPPAVLLRALAEVPLAVAALAPLTDYAVALDTTAPEPALASPNLAKLAVAAAAETAAGGSGGTGGGGAPVETWASFASHWARPAGSGYL
jgi:hypothetical protein